MPSLSTGILSAAQGSYTTAQLLLDITQGARVSASAYNPARPPALSLHPHGAGALVEPWQEVLERAHGAPQILEPGLLASQIPGGGGYAGIARGGQSESTAADPNPESPQATWTGWRRLTKTARSLRYRSDRPPRYRHASPR